MVDALRYTAAPCTAAARAVVRPGPGAWCSTGASACADGKLLSFPFPKRGRRAARRSRLRLMSCCHLPAVLKHGLPKLVLGAEVRSVLAHVRVVVDHDLDYFTLARTTFALCRLGPRPCWVVDGAGDLLHRFRSLVVRIADQGMTHTSRSWSGRNSRRR
jgi:hypothetical protein